MDLAHVVDVDDGGAVHAHEALRVQPPLERGERRAHHVAPVPRVHQHVVVLGLDPDHVAHVDDDRMVVLPEREPRQIRGPLGGGRGFQLLGHRGELGGQLGQPALAHAGLGAADGGGKALVGKRLQHVVDGEDVEGVGGIAPERGDEHNHRARRRERLRQLQAARPRHLDVEEGDVHAFVRQRLLGVGGAPALDDVLDFRIPAEQVGHHAPRQRLVFDHQSAERHHAGTVTAGATEGSSTSAVVPPVSLVRSDSCACGP